MVGRGKGETEEILGLGWVYSQRESISDLPKAELLNPAKASEMGMSNFCRDFSAAIASSTGRSQVGPSLCLAQSEKRTNQSIDDLWTQVVPLGRVRARESLARGIGDTGDRMRASGVSANSAGHMEEARRTRDSVTVGLRTRAFN